ncbi:unnamed protein product [Ilex paraguariensis]|uniref:Major facilitator superfamily (MFS) profile domain-containing protein n=1 Tax=Ilex paraguariensis TaxID=185542 RepID=A0ABC8UNZ0_9AQUA
MEIEEEIGKLTKNGGSVHNPLITMKFGEEEEKQRGFKEEEEIQKFVKEDDLTHKGLATAECGEKKETQKFVKKDRSLYEILAISRPAKEETQNLMKKSLNQIETEAKLELTVDQVVEEYVGSFGLSQLLHVFLVSLAWIFDSQNTLVTIFADAQPEAWRCIINTSCVNGGGDKGDAAAVCRLQPGTWEWTGGRASSTIAEWGLVCDRKFLAALPASLFFFGSLLGSAVFGRLADAFLGRKRTVFISCLLTSTTAFLTSLSPNIWIYALLRFANGFARSGIGICCLVLSTEAVGRKWRGQVGQYGFFFFTAGFLSLPLIAYPTRTHWRYIYRIISFLPLVYSLFILPFVSESPRWLVVRGRSKEALEVLKEYARLNGKKLPANLTLSEPSIFRVDTDGETALSKSEAKMDLWTTKWAAKRMIMLMISGFGAGL